MAAPAGQGARVLRVAYTDDVSSLDPDNAFLLFGLDALRVLYQGLVQYKPGTTEITGWLAESWTISADRRTYTFKLHDGVRFHDGRSLTAADVLAYFERRRDPALALSYFLDGVESMAAPDRLTFAITLKEPEPAFLDRLASPWGPKIVGPDALTIHAGADHGQSWLNEHEDGTGPFRLAEFNRGQRYVLTRDPAYWGPAPWFDRIEIEIVPSVAQQMLMLRQGALDVIPHGYPFDQLSRLPPQLKLTAYDDLGLEMAYVNFAKALGDPAVRLAVLTAIDPHGWVDDAFGGYATAALSLYPKAMLAPPQPFAFPTDLTAARRTIAAKGPVAIEIGYAAEEAGVQQRTAELLVSALRSIGVHATTRSIPLDQEGGMTDFPEKAPDLWLAQNNPDAAHPATSAGVFFATGAPLNIFGYSNPAVDAQIAAADSIADPKARDRAYLAIDAALTADIAFIPLADIKDVIVTRADLTGIETRPALPWTVDYATIRRN